MSKIITLYPAEQDAKEFVYDYITLNKDNIEDIVVLLKFKESAEDAVFLVHNEPTFSILCAMSKLFDHIISKIISEEMEIDDEEEEN